MVFLFQWVACSWSLFSKSDRRVVGTIIVRFLLRVEFFSFYVVSRSANVCTICLDDGSVVGEDKVVITTVESLTWSARSRGSPVLVSTGAMLRSFFLLRNRRMFVLHRRSDSKGGVL